MKKRPLGTSLPRFGYIFLKIDVICRLLFTYLVYVAGRLEAGQKMELGSWFHQHRQGGSHWDLEDEELILLEERLQY